MYLSVFTTTHIIDWDSHSLFKVYWLRYNLENLTERKSHARIRKRNSAFRVDISYFYGPTRAEELLYRKYFLSCGLDTHASISDALSYCSNRVYVFRSMAVRVWDRDKLVAMGIFDKGIFAGASLLHFYDPDYKSRSLGKYLMLLTVDWLKQNEYTFYYPGYILPGQPRFDYKLFLGKAQASVYDHMLNRWVAFSEEMMNPEPYTEDDLNAFYDVSRNHKYDKREFEAAIRWRRQE